MSTDKLAYGNIAPEGSRPAPPIAMVLKDGEPRPVQGRAFFSANFDFGDRVSIDKGDQVGVVVGFCFYPRGKQVQVSWWNNGTIAESWLDEWRLELVEK
jgi:hypothetical protein